MAESMDMCIRNPNGRTVKRYQKRVKETDNHNPVVVYTQTCECLTERYGSLENFWKRVVVSIIPRFSCMVAMIVHDSEPSHVHVILKTKEQVEIYQWAFAFNEVSFRDDYSCDIADDKFTCYYKPLEEVYDMLLRKPKAMTLGASPDFIQHIDNFGIYKENN